MRSSLALRQLPLLTGLSDQRLHEIAQRCHWRSTEAQTSLLTREAQDADFYMLVSGRVRITMYSASGRQVTFRDFGAGDYFGELAAIDGQPRSADVLTLEPSVLAILGRADFLALLAVEPGLALRLMQRMAGLVRQLSERVIDLSTLSVQHRLHAELLALAEAAGVADNQARLSPAPRHLELASRISTNREQVAREMAALSRQGLLAKEGRDLRVMDVSALRRELDEQRRQSPKLAQ